MHSGAELFDRTRYIYFIFSRPRYIPLMKISYCCIRFKQWPEFTLEMSYRTLEAYGKASLELGWPYRMDFSVKIVIVDFSGGVLSLGCLTGF